MTTASHCLPVDTARDAVRARTSGSPRRLWRRFSIREILPPHDPGPWPEGFTVSREQIYDGIGRLTGS